MKKLVLRLIRGYQNSSIIDNPVLKMFWATDTVCRFHPTCSEYTYLSIDKFGVIKGSWIGLKRILRCHPWSKGGEDPIP